MNRIIKFIVLDIIKNRTVLIYTLIMAVLSWGVFSLENNPTKGLLTLLGVILLNVPLVSIIFPTIYLYNSSEFIELLLSQPINRAKIWWSLFLGLTLSMMAAFLAGVGIPLLIYMPTDVGLMMILVGLFISSVFVSIAFLGSVITRDKARGIGIAIVLWLFFALLFDGLVLFLLFQFSEYPIEKAMIGVSMLNPIDLARILILLHLDVSAMMGYTGAIFKTFLGNFSGILFAFTTLLLWIIVPFWISLIKFKKKDL